MFDEKLRRQKQHTDICKDNCMHTDLWTFNNRQHVLYSYAATAG